MNKIGVPPQGTALAGLASIFKKGSATKKLQRSASSSSRDRATPPEVKVKPNKKLSDTNSPNLSRIKNDPSGSPSIRSSFKNKLFKKKKSKLSRGSSTDDMRGSTDDLWSETSSLSSISRISIREEDAFEGNFPRNKESPQHTEKTPPSTKSITSPSREPPLSKTSHEGHPSPKSPTITSTPLLPKEESSLLSSPSRGKDRSDSLFKDMSDLFNDKDNLFDTAELSSLLAKTKSEFGADAKENAPQEKVKVPSPDKPSVTTKPKPKIPIVTEEPKAPSKPMRKNRSRVLDTSMYDKAAEKAIKSVTERKVEKENKKELERKKEEEKKKPKIALFEELDDEDDLFGGKKETQVEEKDTKKSVNKDDLFDDQDEPEKPTSPSVLQEKPPKPEVSVDSALSTTKPDVQVHVSSDKSAKDDKEFEIIKPEEQVKPADEIARPDELVKPNKQVNTDEPAEKPIEQAKPDSQAESKTSSLFDDLDEEKAKKDEETMKSLFGDESENFVSNISGSVETSTKDSTTNKDASKKADVVESKKPEIQVIKPVVVIKKPSITSPTRKELSPPPVKTKPPVLSVKPKPKRVVKTAENEHQKEIKSDIKKEEEPVKIVESAKVELKEKEPTKDGEDFKTTDNKKEQVEKEDLKTNKDESKVDEEEKQKVEMVSEEKEAQAEKDQISNEPEVKDKDKNTKDVKKDDSKPIPEWKKKLEEKRLQREKEERDTALKLEERKKKRDENKLANKDQVKPSAVSPKPVKKPMVPKDKPKPTPITSTTTITLSSKSTTEKEKSPVSPSGTPPPATKELSPSLDPSIPKWKQNLLAKKKQTEGTVQPTSPRKTSSVSVNVKKNDESLPAWKKELLAKKKAVGEVHAMYNTRVHTFTLCI